MQLVCAASGSVGMSLQSQAAGVGPGVGQGPGYDHTNGSGDGIVRTSAGVYPCASLSGGFPKTSP